jgi:polar amino acid transport system substrate-binding protein
LKRIASIAVLWLSAGMPASAVDVRICADQDSHLPFITPAGGGLAGKLIEQAASEVGVRVIYHGAPLVRCREELRAGLADAFPTAPATPALQPFMAFPTNAERADSERAVVQTKALVYRRVGSAVTWDGHAFGQLSRPALIPSGAVLLIDRLKSMAVTADDGAKTLEANFGKLLAGRGDVVIGSEFTGASLLAQERYASRIEALPLPFSDEAYYLAFAHDYYKRNEAQVQRLWEAIARIKRTAAYRAEVERALADYARTLKE